jgi:hypothetical protein
MGRPKGSKNFTPRRKVTDEELERYSLPVEDIDTTRGKKGQFRGPPGSQHVLTPEDGQKRRFKPMTQKRLLARLIQDVGDEVVDPKLGWSRLEALVRRLYNDAIAGHVSSAELLLNRGWGKVPTPVEIDVSGEVRQLVLQAGVSWDQIAKDPVLKSLLESSGVSPAEMSLLESVDGKSRIIDATFSESQVGVGEEED